MNGIPITIVAEIFCGAGALLTMASAVALTLYGIFRWRTAFATSHAVSAVKNPDAVLLLLEGISRAILAIAALVGMVGRVVLAGMTVVATLVLLFGISLFLVGQSLQAHAGWARIMAAVLVALIELPAMLGTLSLRGSPRYVAAFIAFTGALILHSLWNGYGH